MSWDENRSFVKNVLDKILESRATRPTPVSMRQPTRKTVSSGGKRLTFIYVNEELDDLLETSIYWNDDIEIVQSFVMKTIRRFSEEGADQPLLPMFRNNEDKEYALKLLHDTILNEKKYRDLEAYR